MNKSDLIDAIARHADISKAAAGRALDALTSSITATLSKGGSVTLVGFGSFHVGRRTARKGRNPQTGEEIVLEARRVLTFKPSLVLKNLLNDEQETGPEFDDESDD